MYQNLAKIVAVIKFRKLLALKTLSEVSTKLKFTLVAEFKQSFFIESD